MAKDHIANSWDFDAGVFDKKEHVFVESNEMFFEAITFGTHAIVRGDKEMLTWCKEFFGGAPAQDILDGNSLYQIETKLRAYNKKLAGEHVRYLHLYPEKKVKQPDFDYKLFDSSTVKELYRYSHFGSALNFNRDALAIAAYDGGKIVSLAGADDYTDPLWQIGIDTIAEYQGKGLGVYLVKQLALEIEHRNKIPFYTTWSANVASTRVALQAGFYPVWMGYPSEDA